MEAFCFGTTIEPSASHYFGLARQSKHTDEPYRQVFGLDEYVRSIMRVIGITDSALLNGESQGKIRCKHDPENVDSMQKPLSLDCEG